MFPASESDFHHNAHIFLPITLPPAVFRSNPTHFTRSKIFRSRKKSSRSSLPDFHYDFPWVFPDFQLSIRTISIYNAPGRHLWLWSVATRKRDGNVISYNQSCNTDITSEKFAVLFCLCSAIEYDGCRNLLVIIELHLLVRNRTRTDVNMHLINNQDVDYCR